MSNIFEIDDEIVEITYIGEKDTIDINTTGNRLFYANDILTHNSSVDEQEFNHSHISGGISKINTADNVFGIYSSTAMKEQGRYQLQLMKTRSSNGVGKKIDLSFDIDTLRILDTGLTPFDSAGAVNNSAQSQSLMNDIKMKSTVSANSTNNDMHSEKLKSLMAKINK